MRHAVGIDLGTTFSAIAMVNDFGKPELIKNAEGDTLTPSVIYLGAEEPIVGKEAKEMQALGDNLVASFFKRVMGNPNWIFCAGDRQFTPVDLSTLILKKLKSDAEKWLQATIDDAVITVPAYFSDPQRRNTIEAGSRAGFNVLRIINEPTAAAIAYGSRQFTEASQIMIYDLGGGTFDITVASVSPDNIEVIATDGNHELGGKDWDDAILQYIAVKFEEEHGENPLTDSVCCNDMLVQAEE
ncbi:MAG: Hsp70 family protein, partial [bacterium]